jgi:hypothetical protein
MYWDSGRDRKLGNVERFLDLPPPSGDWGVLRGLSGKDGVVGNMNG